MRPFSAPLRACHANMKIQNNGQQKAIDPVVHSGPDRFNYEIKGEFPTNPNAMSDDGWARLSGVFFDGL
ncbi:hypothetical protein FQZ97_667980 [compost metagenome]|jgi:hypothetical protein